MNQSINQQSAITYAGIMMFWVDFAGFSLEESESQKNIMSAQLSVLEERAYLLAGHAFSLTSTDDVAQVTNCHGRHHTALNELKVSRYVLCTFKR